MKKFILIIAVLTLGLASVWGEKYNAVNGTGTSTNVPFNLTTTSSQHIQIIYPGNLLRGTMSDNTSTFTVQTISGIKFFADNNLTLPTGVTYTIKLKQLSQGSFSTATEITLSSEDPIYFTGASPEITNSDNEHSMTFNFSSSFQYTYKSNTTPDALLVDIQITEPTENTSTTAPNWLTSNSTNQSIYKIGNNSFALGEFPNTTFICGRRIGTLINSNSYNVYTADALVAELVQWNNTNSSPYYITTSPSISNIVKSGEKVNFIYVEKEITLPYTIEGTSNRNAALTKLGYSAFSNYQITGNTLIWFTDIQEIGNSNEANACFNFSYRDITIDETTTKSYVSIVFSSSNNSQTNNLPTVNGNDFDYFVSKNASQTVEKRANLYIHDNFNNNDAILTTWKANDDSHTELINKFLNKQWTSYPYRVDIQNKYDNKIDISTIATLDNMPFKTDKLKFTLNGSYGSHDASWHYYHNIQESGTSVTNKGTVNGYGTNSLEYEIKGPSVATLNTKCYAQFEYNHGDPYFDIYDDVSKINHKPIFTECDSLIFKESANTSNVPFFRLQNDGHETAKDTLHTIVDIQVEKEINNGNFRYFSFPFDCSVQDIRAQLTSVDGVAPADPTNMPLYTDDYKYPGANNTDCFIIMEYKGSDSTFIKTVEGEEVHEYGHARYWQIRDANKTLEKNKGYAVAIFESDNHVGHTVKGIIKFKTGTGDKVLNIWNKQLTFDPGDYPTNVCDVDDPDKQGQKMPIAEHNQGWRLVGNPHYNYVKADAYTQKFIGTIDESSLTSFHNTEIEDIKIKPFETFFVKLTEHNQQVTVTPTGSHVDPAYTGVNNLPQMRMSESAVDNRPEHISVSLIGDNNVKDRTTVINKDYVTEHFNNEEDLSKGFATENTIYSYYDSINFLFKALPIRSDSTFIVPLGVSVTEGGNYTFAIDTTLTMFWGKTMLHDKEANQYHQLNENGVQVALNKGTNNTRFELVIIPSEIPTDVDNIETSETLDAYVHDGQLVVENIEEGSNLSIYDISGKLVYSTTAAGNFNYSFTTRGVYMVVLRGKTTGTIKVVY